MQNYALRRGPVNTHASKYIRIVTQASHRLHLYERGYIRGVIGVLKLMFKWYVLQLMQFKI